uniref:Uncharacterized protein n=1 Tax=Siphoviridae sp. ctqSm5 TaxID=2827949 RepID=A0A8S5SPA3_9CAUD|nr:MAG TPA: hypothetical protein [Siphoviridae sp. ctqSm5]DAJ60302.1 MAG TPA: hypothetical protein [Caudoviricetes sp.]
MAIKSTQAVKVQLQQKVEGVLKPVNPATLAELVKLQNGINLETKVGEIESSVEAVGGRVGALEGQMGQAQSDIAGLQAKDGELEQSIASHVGTLTQTIEAEVSRATGEEAAIRGELAQAKGELQGEINNLKSAISDKNSSTLVYSTMDEFNGAVASLDPKVGDLVFVLDVKKAFIYKGAGAGAVAMLDIVVPEGWVLFDEISTDVDLVDYLTREDAQSTYRAKADAIVEGDLDGALQGKINSKADLTHVTSEVARVEGLATAVEGRVGALEGRVGAVEGAVASVDSRIEGAVGALKTELVEDIEAVDAKAIANAQGIATLTSGLQATDGKVATNEGAIATNTGDIATLKQGLADANGKISTNTGDIAQLKSDLGVTNDKVTANKTAIAENKGAIATNASAIAKAKEDITSITEVLNGCIYYTVIA